MNYGPKAVTNGLVLCLDAADPRSYPRTGTVWYDVSGNGYNFNILSTVYNVSNGIHNMDFASSLAKRVVGGVLTNVPSYDNATFIAFTSIGTDTQLYRSLLQTKAGIYPIFVQGFGSNNLGMYNNNFYSASFNVSNIPNHTTKFNMWCWRFSTGSPYYQFQYNNNSTVYSITNSAAQYSNGFCAIGGWHISNTDPSSGADLWKGKIASILYYNRHLTTAEILQNYQTFRSRFGI